VSNLNELCLELTNSPRALAGSTNFLSDTVEPTNKESPTNLLYTLKRDALAGMVTGLVAIPLTVGICLMSEYPIQVGIATVMMACIVSYLTSLVRPGNYVGVPGVAAGLAPVLAMGVHKYGLETMPWLVFLTASMQMLVWHYRLEGYILKAVPHFLIEGLLAGVGLKIALKFFPYTYETVSHSDVFWNSNRVGVIFFSVVTFVLFVYLYKRFKDTNPGLPYLAVIGGSVVLSFYLPFPMLHLDHVPIRFKLPFPDFSAIELSTLVEMLLFAAMVAVIDVIEQVMSNAAIEKIDPLQRKSDSNNSLLAIWIANMASSFFGGMTNLDGLAKSSTNRMAGALTKTSNLFVAGVMGIVLAFPQMLTNLPEFALATLMIFTGWKMIAGLYHVAEHGQYAFGLALFCGVLVFQLGIVEGLLISISVHCFITYVIYKHEAVPTLEILRKFIKVFGEELHPHATATMEVNRDPGTGGLRYSSINHPASSKKSLDQFINDWADGINHRNLLSVVSTYDPSGLLWGTFAKELRSGHVAIKGYFEHLFDLDSIKVHFESGEVRQYKDIYIKSGSYRFSYGKKGDRVTVPARYSFVCKKEDTGWYILEHHSSEFPA
jgi:MFS superfamily sulfate permease-like transporter